VKTTVYEDSHRVSQRVCLRPGDKFRAAGGSVWRTADGKKIPIRSAGPYMFLRLATRGSRKWIEALDRDGCFCVLRIAGSWKSIDKSLLPRPYRIKGRLRK